MLISRRKEGETLFIGDENEVRIVSVREKKVVIGIVAPREVKIAAGKLNPEALANTMAAANAAHIDRFFHKQSVEEEKPMLLLKPASKKLSE